MFNSVQQLNWAWLYLCPQSGKWVQFQCLICMLLESKWQQFNLGNVQHIKIPGNGTIDFEQMTVTAPSKEDPK